MAITSSFPGAAWTRAGSRGWLCWLAILFVFVGAAFPQRTESAKSKEKEVMEKEFAEAKKDPRRYKELVLLSQMALGHLGYGTGPFTGEEDEATKKAVAKFQSNEKLPPTGELDATTLVRLFDAWKETTRPSITLPSLHVGTEFWSEFVSAKGTWIMEGEEQGLPLQSSEIECRRELGLCIEATAIIMEGNHLTVWLEVNRVERWDDYEIVTRPREHECTRYTLRISRSQRSVTGLRSTKKTAGTCLHIEAKDFRLKLEDGLVALRGYEAKRKAALKRYMQASGLLDENE